MERDPKIRQLIKESGVTEAPDGFTGKVMHRIGLQSSQTMYKPLIGRTGKIGILLFVAAMVIVTLLYSDQGETLIGNYINLDLSQWEWPRLDLEFLKTIKPSPGLVSAVVAIFLLVISDAGFRRFS